MRQARTGTPTQQRHCCWSGEIVGGLLYLGGRVYDVNRPIVFDGRQLHSVTPFTGTRVSIVFFYKAVDVPLEVLVRRPLGSGFPRPPRISDA